MKRIMKGAIATGHPLTSSAAAEMLSLGGNAFDAAVSAGFASVVAEPTLASLGGGGFLLAHIEKKKKQILFDFFVNNPGLGDTGHIKPAMTAVDIKFPECTQVFHTGFGSAAVPGMLKGLRHVHKRLCTLPLDVVLTPASRYLEEGIEVSELQGYFLSLLKPIFTSTGFGKELYSANGRYIQQNDRIFNPLLKKFFQGIADGSGDIYEGRTARDLAEEMKKHKGVITPQDLSAYEVAERQPLHIRYRDREILTNPPPSSGGVFLALALHLLESAGLPRLIPGSEEFYMTLVELMKETNAVKRSKNGEGTAYSLTDPDVKSLIESFRKNIAEKTFLSSKGTTHISVIDEEGNAVSMTTSNGSGSGCFIPGTGIMLNNMMGEDDLHPLGFHESPAGTRVSSMMIPTMVMKDGEVESVMGSGGSKRIRTAVLQVLINSIDFHYTPERAVESPRVHYEDGIVHVEPGISSAVVGRLKKHYQVNTWHSKNMYFGGVHFVSGNKEGWGDSRRGGSFVTVR